MKIGILCKVKLNFLFHSKIACVNCELMNISEVHTKKNNINYYYCYCFSQRSIEPCNI